MSVIPLDDMEPLGDEPPVDCVVAYPGATPARVHLVAYDTLGRVRDSRVLLRKRVTEEIVGLMLFLTF
jgi:hypothetical protein